MRQRSKVSSLLVLWLHSIVVLAKIWIFLWLIPGKYDVLENIIYMYVLSGHDFTQTWEILRWHHQYLPTGPTALVQFRVWERGSADLDTLNEKLIGAMKHALNDVIMEYYFLTSSICLVPHQLQDILPTPALSAPSSPVVTKGNGQMLELSAIPLFIQ